MLKLTRMWKWILATLVLVAAVMFLHPQQAGLTVYKVSLVVLSVPLSYWVDRALFMYAPSISSLMPGSAISPARLVCRALIFLGVVVGVTLGL